jgi:hypothetical protein
MLPGNIFLNEPYMRMREGAADGISWWIPNKSCLVQWLQASGFTQYEIGNTVDLTSDKPYIDEATGRSSGVNQTQQLIQAYP